MDPLDPRSLSLYGLETPPYSRRTRLDPLRCADDLDRVFEGYGYLDVAKEIDDPICCSAERSRSITHSCAPE